METGNVNFRAPPPPPSLLSRGSSSGGAPLSASEQAHARELFQQLMGSGSPRLPPRPGSSTRGGSSSQGTSEVRREDSSPLASFSSFSSYGNDVAAEYARTVAAAGLPQAPSESSSGSLARQSGSLELGATAGWAPALERSQVLALDSAAQLAVAMCSSDKVSSQEGEAEEAEGSTLLRPCWVRHCFCGTWDSSLALFARGQPPQYPIGRLLVQAPQAWKLLTAPLCAATLYCADSEWQHHL